MTDAADPSGLVYLGKDGYDTGYRAMFCFEPESRIGVILLRNYNEGSRYLAPATDLLVELVAANRKPVPVENPSRWEGSQFPASRRCAGRQLLAQGAPAGAASLPPGQVSFPCLVS